MNKGGLMSELCEKCNKQPAIQEHHKFSQGTPRGWRRRLYKKLLDHPLNIMKVCQDCHTNERAMKWSEVQFCLALGISPRSKQGKEEWQKKGFKDPDEKKEGAVILDKLNYQKL